MFVLSVGEGRLADVVMVGRANLLLDRPSLQIQKRSRGGGKPNSGDQLKERRLDRLS